jgi:hypothetical protein
MARTVSIGNGWGDSIDKPSLAEMRKLLFDVDPNDDEHGDAWLSADDHTLEWSGVDSGRLVYWRRAKAKGRDGPRHLVGVTRERTLELWRMLAEGHLEEVERQAWLPGNGSPPDAERQAMVAAAERELDRRFYESLGAERPGTRCKREGCRRGTVAFSVFCRPHHFGSVKRKTCPFDD